MSTFKRMLTLFLAAVLAVPVLPLGGLRAHAAGQEQEDESVTLTWNAMKDVDLPEQEELYEVYLQQLFYGSDSASMYSESARGQLGAVGQKLYDYLKGNLVKVAAGEATSTVFEISTQMLSQWGAAVKFDTSSSSAAMNEFLTRIEMSNVLRTLLHDCPYELYWYDKVSGVRQSCKISIGSDGCTITSFTLKFSVAGNYQPAGYDPNDPTFDPSSVQAAAAAAANAKAIVAECAGKSDYEILKAYKDRICQLVSYDYNAAYGGYFSVDPDPWQLIHVFDEDPETRVVCEGYSKAFQYLCDMTSFGCGVSCITVTGMMSGGTGAGGHMWNIVTAGGKNYLVDVTNSDSGTSGQDGRLFMAGAPGSVSAGYIFGGTGYTYDEDTLALWNAGAKNLLELAGENYDPSAASAQGHTEVADPGAAPTCTEPGLTEGRHCAVCGAVLVKQEAVAAKGHTVVTEKAVAPTCGKAGLSEGTHCSVCGEVLAKQETVPATGMHTYKDDKDTTCEVCGGTRETGVETTPMYRLYNPNSGEHFYTGSAQERDNLVEAGWNYEGVAWNAPVKSGTPVHRVYNPNNGDHHYTMSWEEVGNLENVGWQYEGVAWNSAAGGSPQYRLYNPNADCGSHHYTSSTEERDYLVSLGWKYEGIGWYGMLN